ncbi:S-type pyocin domain-containing protein [Pseudomonas fluorescens]|uniref:S-type pyocin domain-containing protein n=1 Tax=Pseudomonas fluorescens TaxID=294 RepID=A0A3S4P6B1_PSEFL|nr:bacteriocin immunity protein [Pseudomonas fluorescens]VEF09735.1 S-type pyocin domain-containing protein [Pseudomonas fluorescens]
MQLKPSLKDYTEPEFQALVDRIWAVDLQKADHDRLINHFDRIAGHPKGADLLFDPPDEYSNPNSADAVVYYVKDWHRKQGRVAFKGQASLASPAQPVIPPATINWAQINQQRIARELIDNQKASADLTTSQRAAQASLSLLEQRIGDLRRRLNAQITASDFEKDIRSLEIAEFNARIAVRGYESWKMSVQFKRDNAQREANYVQAERGQWQSIAQQIGATYDGYVASLTVVNQQFKRFQEEAEILLKTAQSQLVELRERQNAGSPPSPVQLIAPFSFVDARPALLIDGELSRTLESHRVDLQKSIRSAVAEFTWQITSNMPREQIQYAGVLRFEFRSRAEVGRYGVCVPLSEFMVLEGLDWQYLAATNGIVDVPFRMSSGHYAVPKGTLFQGIREITSLQQVAITPVNKELKPGVRVRPATWNESAQTYSFTADGDASVAVIWRLPETLENSSPRTSNSDYRMSSLQSPKTPLIELFSGSASVTFNDYVVVFPADADLEPVYLMFEG